MSMIKAKFIRGLQEYDEPLWPSEISQKIRQQFFWISAVRWDDELDPKLFRGYMVRSHMTRAYTADDPFLYWCVIATRQSMGWSNVTWIKEMLQALDSGECLTSSKEDLGVMIDNRIAILPNGDDTPPNLIADKNGFILALGSAVPLGYRKRLREMRKLGALPLNIIETLNHIPKDYIDFVLNESFEGAFEQALKETEQH